MIYIIYVIDYMVLSDGTTAKELRKRQMETVYKVSKRVRTHEFLSIKSRTCMRQNQLECILYGVSWDYDVNSSLHSSIVECKTNVESFKSKIKYRKSGMDKVYLSNLYKYHRFYHSSEMLKCATKTNGIHLWQL